MEHSRSIFEIYELDTRTWITCQVAENCNLNGRVVKILDIANVGCAKHKLNLEVESLVSCDEDLKACIEAVHGTMIEAKSRLNEPRHASKHNSFVPDLLQQYKMVRQVLHAAAVLQNLRFLRTVAESEGSTVTMNLTPTFKAKLFGFAVQLSEIDSVAMYLQTENLTLADCRVALKTLMDAVQEQKDDENAKLYKCKLRSSHISSNSRHCRHKVFESGVVKLQRIWARALTLAERSLLLYKDNNTSTECEVSNDTSRDVLGQIRKRQKLSHASPKYMDAISVAKVERLWSLATYVLTKNRKSCTPILAEAILFLKVNSSYWDCALELCQ